MEHGFSDCCHVCGNVIFKGLSCLCFCQQSATWDVIAVLLPVGGNRTHVTVPKDILMTIPLYHSAVEVRIEFDRSPFTGRWEFGPAGGRHRVASMATQSSWRPHGTRPRARRGASSPQLAM